MDGDLVRWDHGNEFQTPPGFVPLVADGLGGIIGVMPKQGGRCEWVRMFKGARSMNARTVWGVIPEDENEGERYGSKCRVEIQKYWLQCFRERVGWEVLTDATGQSWRTWEGWEQGRAIPFHHMAMLARHAWEWKNRSENKGTLAAWRE